MKKRVVLWGSLAAAMVFVVVVMVRFAGDDTVDRTQSNAGAGNSSPAHSEILDIRENDWTKGNPDADVVIVKYSDFQCPACRFFASIDDRLSDELGDDVLFVYRHFPLSSFQYSQLAAQYTEAAGRQGQFWRMHDLIFINQQTWSRGDGEALFQQFAESMDLDMEQFEEDLEDPEVLNRIESDFRDGQRLGVRAVPTIFINGEMIDNPNSMDAYENLIKSQL